LINVNKTFVIFFIFLLVNVSLFFASKPQSQNGELLHATYANASDGQRYWGVAKNLIANGSFSVPKELYGSTKFDEDIPLARAAPVPALVFAGPMLLAGFDKAPLLIVTLQCAMLFLIGYWARGIGEQLGINKLLLQCLIIFNPSLLGLAHLAQSDFLFSFFTSLLLILGIKVISVAPNLSIRGIVLIGVVAGICALTRPVGYYVALVFPIILVGSVAFNAKKRFPLKKVAVVVLSVWTLAYAVCTPWMTRNYLLFGDFSIVRSENSIMLEQQFKLVLAYNGLEETSQAREQAIATVKKTMLWSESCGEAARRDLDDLPLDLPKRCDTLKAIGFARAILDRPIQEIFRAVWVGWSTLFLAGGTGRLRNYLGLESGSSGYIFDPASFYGLTSIFDWFKWQIDGKIFWMLLFVTATGFAVGLRLAGLVGLASLLRKKESREILIFCVSNIALFTGICVFYSLTRYRAPMEMALAILGAIGLQALMEAIQNRSLRQTLKPGNIMKNHQRKY